MKMLANVSISLIQLSKKSVTNLLYLFNFFFFCTGAKRRLAFLDAMVEMTKNPDIAWTEKDVMDEVNTIMFEV